MRRARRPVGAINRELRAGSADHPYVPLLLTAPGIGWVLAYCAGRCLRQRCTRFATPPTQSATSEPSAGWAKQRRAKVAQIDVARHLTEAIWHMLTRDEPFAPKGAAARRIPAAR